MDTASPANGSSGPSHSRRRLGRIGPGRGRRAVQVWSVGLDHRLASHQVGQRRAHLADRMAHLADPAVPHPARGRRRVTGYSSGRSAPCTCRPAASPPARWRGHPRRWSPSAFPPAHGARLPAPPCRAPNGPHAASTRSPRPAAPRRSIAADVAYSAPAIPKRSPTAGHPRLHPDRRSPPASTSGDACTVGIWLKQCPPADADHSNPRRHSLLPLRHRRLVDVLHMRLGRLRRRFRIAGLQARPAAGDGPQATAPAGPAVPTPACETPARSRSGFRRSASRRRCAIRPRSARWKREVRAGGRHRDRQASPCCAASITSSRARSAVGDITAARRATSLSIRTAGIVQLADVHVLQRQIELDRPQQRVRPEVRDIGAAALPGPHHPQHRQPAHRLAHRWPRHIQRRRPDRARAAAGRPPSARPA